jgi:TorA maturation chaperone TorD
MTASTQDTAAYHSARAACYAAAAELFCYPDDDLLELADDEVATHLRAAADAVGVRDEADAVLDALADATSEDLRSAYDHLFGLPSDDGTYPVVPYEAHYTTMGEISAEQRRIATVVGLMEAVGVEPSDGFDERQDHVAAELELMQVLAGQRVTALADDDSETAERVERAEATALGEHLVEFVPAFVHDLHQATDDPVYTAAGEFVRALVEADHAAHPEPPETPDPAGDDPVQGGEHA